MTQRPWLHSFALLCLATALALPLRAQLPTLSDVDQGSQVPAAGPLPDWDVAVIKPHPPEDGVMSWNLTDNGLSLRNLSLEQMICSAWDFKPYQVSGLTGWMKSTRYDLTAKVSGEDEATYKKLSTSQRRQMLQLLLTQRFHLKVHTETRTLPTYDLIVDKNGSKLKPSTAIDAPSKEELEDHPEKYKKGYMMTSPGKYEAFGVPARWLASQLSNELGRPVHDATGLTGSYDITLHYRPQEAAVAGDDDGNASSVFSAVQDQLGLKLVASKGPVDVLLVEAAQKPDDN